MEVVGIFSAGQKRERERWRFRRIVGGSCVSLGWRMMTRIVENWAKKRAHVLYKSLNWRGEARTRRLTRAWPDLGPAGRDTGLVLYSTGTVQTVQSGGGWNRGHGRRHDWNGFLVGGMLLSHVCLGWFVRRLRRLRRRLGGVDGWTRPWGSYRPMRHDCKQLLYKAWLLKTWGARVAWLNDWTQLDGRLDDYFSMMRLRKQGSVRE